MHLGIRTLSCAIAALVTLQVQAATDAYIASPDDGLISHYRLEDKTGALKLLAQTPAGTQVGPLALSPSGQTLYAALRSKPYTVKSYHIDHETGALEAAGQAPLAESLAYLATDHSGRWLLGASYGGDLLSTQPLDDRGQPASDIRITATGPHAHSIRTDPSNRFAYAGNLGNDHVLQYRFADGVLTPIGQGFVQLPAGTGPRHLAFSKNGRFVYVVGEMSGTVTGFAINPETGALSQVDSASGIPASLNLAHGLVRDASTHNLEGDPTRRIWAADLRMSPDGTLLMMSERTSSSVSAFQLDAANGHIKFLGNHPVQEQQPRNLAFSPDGRWLLVTGEKSATVGSYSVGAGGSLRRVSEAPSGKGALWIEIGQSGPN
ncbi:lactonase family protein [Pseudomonas sp. CBMAI 2609]|uniref:Lactonase family protein n=1 Tax=Pseudomonas flavocrustae TaxID=2991719 RepID=A0ABT6IIS1_9PSED|nr:lactonase family protein [Pseudomonas sp. CBMAI 2609]MDH4764173.1 lactonase family protein [Pseudomonas sp. CBMAI 2609]